jgi:hypothetical protein
VEKYSRVMVSSYDEEEGEEDEEDKTMVGSRRCGVAID